MLTVKIKSVMLSVMMLNVIMLIVVAPTLISAPKYQTCLKYYPGKNATAYFDRM
jgi:hypothetical protein